jgi:hypothetical protein
MLNHFSGLALFFEALSELGFSSSKHLQHWFAICQFFLFEDMQSIGCRVHLSLG